MEPSETIDEAAPKERTVHKYLFPAGFYENDIGGIAYFCASPFEVPYRIIQMAKDGFFHVMGMEHGHEP